MKSSDGRMCVCGSAATDASVTSFCVPRSDFALILGRCVLEVVVAAVGCGEGRIVAAVSTCSKIIRDRLCTCISPEYSVAIFCARFNPLIVWVQLNMTLAMTGTRHRVVAEVRLASVGRTAASKGSKNLPH